MPARRFILLIAVLTGLFVLGVALAMGGLLALRDPGIVLVCVVALVAGVLAAGLAYLAVRIAAEEGQPESAGLTPELPLPEPETQTGPTIQQLRRRPIRIQSMPVAELPAPYLAAVMKGLHASRREFRPEHQL